MKLIKATTRSALDAILARQTTRVQNAFRRFLRNARTEETMAAITRLLQRGDVEGALRIVDQHVIDFGRVIPTVFNGAGAATMTALRRTLGESGVDLAFNPGNPRAAETASRAELEFVQQFTEEQRANTRDVISRSLAEGKGYRAVAREFRDSIGLTTAQQSMVDSYQDALERGSSNALDRALRDRRFDPTVENAVDGAEVLSGDQIETMVGRYTENMLGMRAETIARTESLRAVSEARHEAMQQMLDETGINPDLVRRTWVATNDNRTRDSHIGLDGQTVGVDEPFVTEDGVELMYPGDPDGPAEEVINCRCTVSMEIAQPEE